MKTLILNVCLFLVCLPLAAQDFWVPLELPNPNTGISCMKSYSQHEFLVGTGLGLYKTTDNGETWILTNFENYVTSIDINYSNGDIFIGNHLGLFYSNDSGNTWNSTVYQENANAIFLSKENYILIGYWGGIAKTNYTGTNVDVILSVNSGCLVTSFAQNSAGVLFAGTVNFFGNSGVYRSFDGGNTWEHCWSTQNYVFAITVDKFGNIYAGGHGLWCSNDLGITWQLLNGTVAVFNIVITAENHIYIGCSSDYYPPGGVYCSFDNGTTWDFISSGLTNRYVENGMALSADGYLFAGCRGEYGHALFRTTTPVLTSIQIEGENEQLLVFPNPVRSLITYSMGQSFAGKPAQLKIFNLTGEELITSNLQIESINSLDISYLLSGTYIFCLQLKKQVFN